MENQNSTRTSSGKFHGSFLKIKALFSGKRKDEQAVDNIDKLLEQQAELAQRCEILQAANEVAMVNSEKKLLQVTDNVPVLLALLDRDLRFVFANSAYEKFFHLQRDEIVGHHFADIIGTSAFSIIHPQFSKALFGVTVSLETRITNASQETLDVQSTFVPYLKEGEIIGVLITFIDISDRIKMEKLLRRSEIESRAITFAVPDLFFRLNREGVILSSQTRDYESLYLPPDQFINKTISQVLPSHVAEPTLRAIEKALKSDDVITFEYELEIKGENKHFEDRIVAISSQEVLSIIRDITARRKAEKALFWNESLLKMTTSSSPLAFYVVDNRTDDILFFNQQFCHIWGLTDFEEKMKRRELKNSDIIPHCFPVLVDARTFAESCKPLQSEDHRSIVEDQIPFKDGRTIRRFSVQIRDEMDRYQGRLYIFEDITERKRSESFLQTQRDLAIALSKTSNIDAATAIALETFLTLEEIDAGGIYLEDPVTGKAVLRHHKGFSEYFIENIKNYHPSDYQIRMIMAGKPIFGPYKDIISPDYLEINHDKVLGLAIIPLMHEGKVLGTINLTSKRTSVFGQNIQAQTIALSVLVGGAICRIYAENALLSSQQNFRMVFDTIDDFLFIFDMDGKIIKTNFIAERRLGYTGKELQSMEISDVHPPESKPLVNFLLSEIISGRTTHYNLPLLKKDRTQIPAEMRVVLGCWDGRKVMFGISRDITERQKSEDELKMQSAAFESFSLAIIITDLEGKITWANSAFSRLIGYDLKDIIGKTNAQLVKSGEQDDLFYSQLWTTIRAGKVWSGEIINKKRDGTRYPEELTITPVFNHSGAITSFIAIKIDISMRKKLEKSLRNAIVREKELNDLKSRFVSMASHEFRTPLSSILLSSETLIAYWERMDAQQIHGKLNNIKWQVDHLARVVKDVMEVAKIQEGRMHFEPVHIDLVELCRFVVDNFNHDYKSERIIKFSSKRKLLHMKLDVRLMQQTLNNLLSNAIKYTPENPKITIEIEEWEEEVIIQVSDNGIGIPVGDQKHLFEPFFRAANTGQIQGNGLGLNIVWESIQMHGGHVTFSSVLKKGSVFTIHLPKNLLSIPSENQ